MLDLTHALPPSRRGRQNIQPDLMNDFSRRLVKDRYHPLKNPRGLIDLGSAVNELMLDDISAWMRWRLKRADLKEGLGYSDTQGSPELLSAVADFMNEHSRARIPLTPNNILAANGASNILNTLTYNIADAGNSILLPTPSNGMLGYDLCTRNGVHLVRVPCDDIPNERFTGSSPQGGGQGRPCELVSRLEDKIQGELSQNRKVAGILLANPENPLGRCYSAHVLLQVSQLCARHKIHLIVDEVYTMNAGENFSSMLSLGLDTNFRNVHVLWSMSKDFGLSGIWLGFLATYNEEVYAAMRSSSMYGSVSSFGATVATKLLSDKKYLRDDFIPTYNRRLKKRRFLVQEELEKFGIPFLKADSGFFMFIDLSDYLDLLSERRGKTKEEELLNFLMFTGVFLEPGEAFFSRTPGWFRLNFGGEKDTVKTGLQRLFNSLKTLEIRREPPTRQNLAPYSPPLQHLGRINYV